MFYEIVARVIFRKQEKSSYGGYDNINQHSFCYSVNTIWKAIAQIKVFLAKSEISNDPANIKMNEIHEMLRKSDDIDIKSKQGKKDKTAIQNKKIN